MQKLTNSYFYGDEQKWAIGVVEDIFDPLKAGRVKVRVLGLHPISQLELATDDLPWSQVVLPTTSAALSGFGASPVGLIEGSTVYGIFLDGESKQQFLVIGSMPGVSYQGSNQQFQYEALIDEETGLPVDPNQNISGASNPEKAFRFFVMQGYTRYQSAGITAALITRAKDNKLDTNGDGIGSWNDVDLNRLRNYAFSISNEKFKYEWNELYTQLSFLSEDLINNEIANDIKKTDTALEAAKLITRKYFGSVVNLQSLKGYSDAVNREYGDLIGVEDNNFKVPKTVIDTKKLQTEIVGEKIETIDELQSIFESTNRKITELIVHDTNTYKDEFVTVRSLDALHKSLGLEEIAFHYLIMPNGDLYSGKDIEKPDVLIEDALTINYAKTISETGKDFIKNEEGLRLKAYEDPVGSGNYAIGYAVSGAKKGDTITQAEADIAFDAAIKQSETDLLDILDTVKVNQHQFDALMSLLYNIGKDKLKTSSVMRHLEAKRIKEAANAFLKFRYATINGKKQPVLLSRRRRERNLFLTQVSNKEKAVTSRKQNSISVAFVGGLKGNRKSGSKDRQDYTIQQYKKFEELVKSFTLVWPISNIYGHKDISNLAKGPNFDVAKFAKSAVGHENKEELLPIDDEDFEAAKPLTPSSNLVETVTPAPVTVSDPQSSTSVQLLFSNETLSLENPGIAQSIVDLTGFLTGISGESIGTLKDVDISSISDGQSIKWDSSINQFVSYTPSSGGGSGGSGGLYSITDTIAPITTTDYLSFIDVSDSNNPKRITASNFKLNLNIVSKGDNISDLANDASYISSGANIDTLVNNVGYITATLSNEQVEDIVGNMVLGNTETLISVTYDDAAGKLNFVVDTSVVTTSNYGHYADSSGIDADLLDGVQGASYVKKSEGISVLNDISTTAPTSNQFLRYNSLNSQWEPTSEIIHKGTSATTGINNGATSVRVDDGDFILYDSTEAVKEFFWRDFSANKLFIGTVNAVPTTRADLKTDGGDTYWHSGNDSSLIKTSSSIGDLSDVDITTNAITNGQSIKWDGTNNKFIPFTLLSSINELTDVDISTNAISNGQAIKWDSVNSKFIPYSPIVKLSELTDVDVTSTPIADGQSIKWDNTSGKFIPYTIPTGGSSFYSASDTIAASAATDYLSFIDVSDTNNPKRTLISSFITDNQIVKKTDNISVLNDVSTTTPTSNQVLQYNGTSWAPSSNFIQEGYSNDNGQVVIRVDDADFILYDSTETPSNLIWRDWSAGKLFFGTATAIPTTRADLKTDAGDTYWHSGNDSSLIKTSSSIGDLSDVDITTNAILDGQSIKWDNVNGKFIPYTPSTGGSGSGFYSASDPIVTSASGDYLSFIDVSDLNNPKRTLISSFITDNNIITTAGGTFTGNTVFNNNVTFNNSLIIGKFSGNIASLVGGSVTGQVLYGPPNAHVVIALKENDVGDSFSIVSGGGNYQTDTTYDTLELQVKTDGTFTHRGNKVLTEVDEGHNNGIDSDTVDGYHVTRSGDRWNVLPVISAVGVLEAGRYIDFHNSDTDVSDYAIRLDTAGGTSDLYINGNKIYNSSDNVSLYTGTPANNQLGVWTNGNTLEGDANLTWDGTTLSIGDGTNFTKLVTGTEGQIKATTNFGYFAAGPVNTSFCHIYTDSTKFYFSRPVYVDGTGSGFYVYRASSLGGSNTYLTQSVGKIDGYNILTEADRNVKYFEYANTSSLTYYVNSTTGSDTNDGLTTGTAFATINKAIDIAQKRNIGNFNILISVADGTYNERVIISGRPLGEGVIKIQGNIANPENVIIDTPDGICFIAKNQANVIIVGFTVTSSNTTTEGAKSGFHVQEFSKVAVGSIRVDGSITRLFYATQFSLIIIAHDKNDANTDNIHIADTWLGTPSINGKAAILPTLASLYDKASLSLYWAKINIPANPATTSGNFEWSASAGAFYATQHARVWLQNATFVIPTGVTVTGRRYNVSAHALIDATGHTDETTAIPGDVAGALGSGGSFKSTNQTNVTYTDVEIIGSGTVKSGGVIYDIIHRGNQGQYINLAEEYGTNITGATLKSAIDKLANSYGGDIIIDRPITVTSTCTLDRNSAYYVKLRFFASGKIIDSIANGALFNATKPLKEFHTEDAVFEVNGSKTAVTHGIIVANNGCYDCKHTRPYLKKGTADPASFFYSPPNQICDELFFINPKLDGAIYETITIGGNVNTPGSSVWFTGGRIIGRSDRVGTGIRIAGAMGGVYITDMDIIQLDKGILVENSGGSGTNREVFINNSSLDGCKSYGIEIKDDCFVQFTGGWAASCDIANVYFHPATSAGRLRMQGTYVYNAGAIVSTGACYGLRCSGQGGIDVSDCQFKFNKGQAIYIESTVASASVDANAFHYINNIIIDNNATNTGPTQQIVVASRAVVHGVKGKGKHFLDIASGYESICRVYDIEDRIGTAGPIGTGSILDGIGNGVDMLNDSGFDFDLYIRGGTVGGIFLNGNVLYDFQTSGGGALNEANAVVRWRAGETIKIAYSPTVPNFNLIYV